MADTTKLVIELETVLRNLNRTLRGLDQVKRKLEAVANVKFNARATTSSTDRQTLAAQRLAVQQERLRQAEQRLSVQSQELANRQERARQTTERLVRSSERLAQQQQRTNGVIRESQKSVITLDQTLGRVGGSLRNLGLGLVSLGASLSVAITAPLTALGVLSTRNAVTLDSLNRGLVAITGSSEEAGRQLTRLTKIAKLPGIGFQEAIQGSIRLQAVGFSAELAERALIQFSNAVALTGGGRDELARITVQLGQLAAKGKVLAQDLKPIIEAGPAVGRALLQAFGTVNSEDIQALGLSSQEFIDRLLTQLEQLPRAAAGIRNTFDNFTDAVFRASAAIGGAILPVLTRLIEVAEPIITRLAEGFAKLPAPVQTLVIVFGALAAAAGPALFVLGQFATGIGGLISAFGRLHALGLLPTIAGFKNLILVMRGATVAMTAQQVAAAGAAASLVGLGVAVAAIAAFAVGLTLLARHQKEAVKISKEQIEATDAQIATLRDQIKFTDSLKSGVKLTSDQQERLAQIYAELNTQAKVRLTAITDEEKRLGALREELQKLLVLRNEERTQQAANLAASLANTVQQVQLGQAERDSIAARVRANVELAKSIQETGQLTTAHRKQLALQGIVAGTVEEALGALNAENETLIGNQGELIASSKELNGTAKEQAEALKALQQQTGLSTRQLLSAAKAMGVFKGDIEAVLPQIEAYITGIKAATSATDEFERTLQEQSQGALRAGSAVEALIKADKALIEANVRVAKEATNSFEGARKSLVAFIRAQPLLAQAVENERRRAGKSLSEFLDDILLEGADRRTQNILRRQLDRVREARDQLAEARAAGQLDLLRSRIENEFTATKNGLDRELTVLEANFDDRLVVLKKYLKQRQDLEEAQVDREIQKELELSSVLFQELTARGRQAQREFETELREITEDPRLRGRAKAAAIEAAELKKATDLEKARADFAVKHADTQARVAELEERRKQIGEDLLRFEREITRQLGIQQAALRADLLEEQGRTADAASIRLRARFTETLRDLRIDVGALSADLQTAIAEVDLTTLQARLNELPEPIRVMTELLDIAIKRAQIAELAQFVDDLSAGLRLDEQRIQNRVLDGLISQREAQAQIVELQRQYKGQLLDVLKGELKKAELIGDQALILSLQQQILETERLGIAVDEVGQRINQALFQDLQSGLAGIFSGARRGFEGLRDAAISFGERLLDTLNDIAATSIIEKLRDAFKPDALNTEGTVGGFISKLFGLAPKVNPVTVANTTATVANTAALVANTAALVGTAAAGVASGGLGGILSGALGAATGLFPATPGGVIRVLEGGHPEAILTTDPKHAAQQVQILRAFLKHTKGLGGRIKSFAAGGFISPHEAQSMMLGGLSSGRGVSNANIGEMAIAGTPSMMRLRQVLVDSRSYRDWITSSEGEQVLVDFLHRKAPVVRNIAGGKK